MTKEKKILLNYLLKQYKQSINQSLRVGDIVQVSIKQLSYSFNTWGIERMRKRIARDGNKWKIVKLFNPHEGDFGAASVMLDDMPGGNYVHIVNINDKHVVQSLPDYAVRRIK